MAHKKPTDLIELAQDWERKLAKCEQQKADLLAALKAALPVLRLAHDTGYDEAAAFDAARAAIERNN